MTNAVWCLVGGPVLILLGLVGRNRTDDHRFRRGARSGGRASGLDLRSGSEYGPGTLKAMAWFLVAVGALAFLIGLADVLFG